MATSHSDSALPSPQNALSHRRRLNLTSIFTPDAHLTRSHYDAQSSWTTAKEAHRIMADPFEVRMRFSNQLGQLNASVVSLQKAATYALKFKDMDEDLHSCILEQVERVSAQQYRWCSALICSSKIT